jgi:hypothetical protein
LGRDSAIRVVELSPLRGENKNMHVRVLFFGRLKDIVGRS